MMTRTDARLIWTLCIAQFLLTMLTACQQAAPPSPPAAPQLSAPKAPASQPAVAAPPSPPLVAMPAKDFLPGPLYFCDAGGRRKPIEFDTRVEQLCRRHPEMGPCQYERGACRAGGGRVFTARGEEVTLAVESEYDRVVRRVRFQADTPPAQKR